MIRSFTLIFVLAFVSAAAFPAANRPAAVPTPAPAPGGPANVFYGGVNPASPNAPVLLFVHGLGSNAMYWFTGGNDMYSDAYNAGYRTVYISMNADNSGNSAPIAQNAATLQQLLPGILAYYKTSSVYLVCHSKGGLDAQDAMLSPAFMSSVKGVFTLASPNQGDALADWAYGKGNPIAARLGMLSPGLSDLQTSVVGPLRIQLDPLFSVSGIPFYTLEGNNFRAEKSVFYGITGPILKSLTGGEDNDGLVAVEEVPLPVTYAQDMGQVSADHTHVGYGSISWASVAAHLPVPLVKR